MERGRRPESMRLMEHRGPLDRQQAGMNDAALLVLRSTAIVAISLAGVTLLVLRLRWALRTLAARGGHFADSDFRVSVFGHLGRHVDSGWKENGRHALDVHRSRSDRLASGRDELSLGSSVSEARGAASYGSCARGVRVVRFLTVQARRDDAGRLGGPTPSGCR